MLEDSIIKLFKMQLGTVYEQIKDKQSEVRSKQHQLDIIQEERDILQAEIKNLIYEAESIQRQIDELNG